MSRIVLLSMLAAAGLLLAPAAHSQAPYPSKPVRFIMPYPPGGSSEILARPIALELSKNLGQPVIIDYKPGAGYQIVGSTPAQLDAYVKTEIARWSKVVRDSGAKVE